MAKTTAPLLSFGGSGAIAKSMVYSTWKGVPYVRRYVVPANPRTAAQQGVRTLFAFLREIWKIAPVELTEPWNAFAKGRPFTGMNKEVGENVRILNGQANMDGYIASPGAAGGLPPASFSADTGAAAGEIDYEFVPPSIPDGWVLDQSVVIVIKDQDPTGIFDGGIFTDVKAVAPYTGTVDGLTTGESYQVCGYLRWTKPNGTKAYSVSMNVQTAAG